MNKVKNVSRYWIDKDSKVVVRKWTDEEYKTNNPRVHIFEKYWSFRCSHCSFIPIPVISKEEVEHTQSDITSIVFVVTKIQRLGRIS